MTLTRVSALFVACLLLVSPLAGGALAQSQEDSADDEEDDLFTSLESMVPVYNENADSVDLGPVNLAGTSNVYIEDNGSVRAYAVTMNADNEITNLSRGHSDDAVRKITTDRDTIERIASADDPAAAFRDAVAEDDIVIAGERGHPVESVKWAVVNVLKGLFL